MEEVEGITFEEYVGERAVHGRLCSSDQVNRWGSQLAAALETIHSKGLIYRDLKSSNVIVAPWQSSSQNSTIRASAVRSNWEPDG
jgi:serine/threonine protein kinase